MAQVLLRARDGFSEKTSLGFLRNFVLLGKLAKLGGLAHP